MKKKKKTQLLDARQELLDCWALETQKIVSQAGR